MGVVSRGMNVSWGIRQEGLGRSSTFLEPSGSHKVNKW